MNSLEFEMNETGFERMTLFIKSLLWHGLSFTSETLNGGFVKITVSNKK